MLRPIVLYPDPRLKMKSKPVTDFTPDLADLALDMTETMRQANGIGRFPGQGESLKIVLTGNIPAETNLHPQDYVAVLLNHADRELGIGVA